MELKEYRSHVKRLAAERQGIPVYNGSPDHAAIIVENMFAAARSKIRLLTGDFNAKVYGNSAVVQRAREFIAHSDHTLEILVEDVTFNSSHPLVAEIGAEDNVTFYEIPKAVSARIGFHFMTADDDCFRYEAEKNSHVAVAAFGDRETAQHLNEVFHEVLLESRELDKASLTD